VYARFRAAATACLAIAISACGESDDLPPIRYRTEHLLIGTDFEAPVCKGSLSRLERHVLDLEQRLGVAVDRQFELYWYEDLPPCATDHAAGCYDIDSGIIRTTYSAAQHELAHAVSHLWGHPDRFYSEGVAEAFSGERSGFGSAQPSKSLGLSGHVPTKSAAHFVRWLYESRGASPLRVLFQNAPRKNQERARRAFALAYAQSIEQAEASYYAEAPEYYPGFSWCFDDLEVLPWQGSFWRHSVELDCASEHTLGAGNLTRSVGFDVEIGGRYTFEVDAPGRVYITTCQTAVIGKGDSDLVRDAPVGEEPGGEVYSSGAWITPGVPQELELSPGRYRVTIETDQTDRTDVRLYLGPVLSGTRLQER
jgi:hypothetical protein